MTSCHPNGRIVSPAQDVPGALRRSHLPCSKNRKSSAAITLFYINVGDQLSLQLAPVAKTVYQPRGINVLQLLFKKHFQGVADQYEAKHSIIYGRFRIERITEVV